VSYFQGLALKQLCLQWAQNRSIGLATQPRDHYYLLDAPSQKFGVPSSIDRGKRFF
jgi:hypothetical protein